MRGEGEGESVGKGGVGCDGSWHLLELVFQRRDLMGPHLRLSRFVGLELLREGTRVLSRVRVLQLQPALSVLQLQPGVSQLLLPGGG